MDSMGQYKIFIDNLVNDSKSRTMNNHTIMTNPILNRQV
jgi:hypothetical protein